MSKVEKIESDLQKLSVQELEEVRDWIENFLEDQLQFTPEFEGKIQQSERDREAGVPGRVRRPEGPA